MIMDGIMLARIYYFPVIQSIILVCGTILCLIVAAIRGDVSIYLPFVSETGAYSPEKCIFSLTLILGSFLGFVSMFFNFLMIRENPLNEQRSFFLLNTVSFVVGSVSMLGMAGVAAFPMTTVFWVHLLFAAVYFIGSAIYIILICIITHKREGASKVFLLRSRLAIAITIFLFLIAILFPLSLVRWHAYNDFIPALKTPEKKGFTLLLISSILEWSIVIVIIIFMLTVIVDLKQHHFQITVIKETSKTAAVTEGSEAPQN